MSPWRTWTRNCATRRGRGPAHVPFRRATRGVPGFRSLCVRLRRRDRRARCDDHRQVAGHHRAGHTRRRDARLRGAASRVALLRRHHGIEAHGMTLPPRRTFADREEVLRAVMLGPPPAYVILLVGLPFLYPILLSFSNATAGSLSFGWAGFDNYVAILGDPIFLRALRNSVVVTVGSQVLVVVLATAAAQVFRATFRGKRFARFVLLLPWAVPV